MKNKLEKDKRERKKDGGAPAREKERRKMAEAGRVWDLLSATYPDAHCALIYGDPWQLLVSTILSAQCTDKRVNLVTPGLFKKFPTVEDMAGAETGELENIIRSTGFFRNKAKSILLSARKIVDDFQGRLPEKMDDLLTLAGVARKTANVVLFNAFGRNEGVVVDTHILRTSRRLGLTKNTDPKKIEQDLMAVFPRANWGMLGHYLIDLGRDVCKARKPDCQGCLLKGICPSAFKVNKAT